MIDEVHAAGGRMGPQIWHTGSVKHARLTWTADAPFESPSGLERPGVPHGWAMGDAAVADAIASFGLAAAEAKRLGFDTFELHGAHGYLIDEFLRKGTNQRTDRFGGATLAERSRFAVEVLKAVRAAVGPDFPVLLRVSQWKLQDNGVRLATTPGEMEAWLTPLFEAGADMLHGSGTRNSRRSTAKPG